MGSHYQQEVSASVMSEATASDGDAPVSAAGSKQRRPAVAATQTDSVVKATLLQIYDELFAHDGYATLKVEMRLLRRGQKEVIIDAGKQFRFVVDFLPADARPPSQES